MSGQRNRSDFLCKSSYRGSRLLKPKSRKIKEKYFEIYQNYILTHSTEKQLAEKYNLGLAHISAIIKWCVHQVDTGDPDVYFKAMDDTISHKLQELELKLRDDSLTHKEWLMTQAEIRRTLKFQAQIRKVLGQDSFQPMQATQVNITSNVPHRVGIDNKDTIDVENESS